MESNAEQILQVQRMFLTHAAPLRGFIFGLVPNRTSAEDVFQEVFITVTQRAADFDSQRSFAAWVRGIARNKVLEHYRRCGKTPQLFDTDLLELLAAGTPHSEDVWESRRAALGSCIEQLAPRARQILELRYAEQPLSPPQIAERLAWTVEAVNVALSRARQFLQECTRNRLQAEGVS